MNIRKPIDYGVMYTALNALMTTALSQMKLYYGIGRIVSARPEKGAAVAAAEYLSKVYPDINGFSPRNLRRIRQFYRIYKSYPQILDEAMTIGWTQNVVILENCKSFDEQVWYIRAVRQFSWTKAELLEKIYAGAYLEISLNLDDESCYTKAKAVDMKSTADNKNSHCSLWQGPDEKMDPKMEFQIESTATSDGHARHNLLIGIDQTSFQSRTHTYGGDPDGSLRPRDTDVPPICR